jgi:hypothetical protein
MPAPGSQYDRFEVEEILGQGGMATVYRVRHTTLGSLHALKVLDLPFPSIRARLVQEGRVQARLRHPHIVAVTDLIEVEGSPGLIMEYVHGPTLQAWLHDNRADAATAARVMSGILDAVAFAHREGLIHRDLKPGNVLLQDVDGRLFPKVTDFGLAKLLGGTAAEHRTRTGFAMGTPGYMAPEQIRSAKDVDARADVFALGCIVYELWTGVRAFPSEDVFVTLELMEAGRYVDPRTHVPSIPDTVVDAIRGALAPEREHRLASCEALRAALVGDATSRAPVALWAAADGLSGAIPAGAGLGVPSPGRDQPARPLAAAPARPRAPAAQTHAPPSAIGAEVAGASRSAPTINPDVFADPPTSRVGAAIGAAASAAAVLFTGGALLCAGVVWWAPWRAGPPSVEAPEVVPLVIPESVPLAAAPLTEAPVEAPKASPKESSPKESSPKESTPTPVTTLAPTTPLARDAPLATGGEPPIELPRPAPAEVGRFVLSGKVDSAWLERGGRRFGPGPVAPGDYTLHARWGTTEVERSVTVTAGQTVSVTCQAAFANCVIQ